MPIKAQDSTWAWAGVKHGTPEGLTDFMALGLAPPHGTQCRSKAGAIDGAWAGVKDGAPKGRRISWR
ncbi:MAG: hypothetical protein OXT64_10580 [Gammaproteobacteria bacterium]|nr:hypothetical protein [Gammaproteobacteria bacterium]